MKTLCLPSFASFSLLLCAVVTSSAQSTVFTYQGRLSDTNGAANGVYDLQFSLLGTASGGSTLTTPVSVAGLGITNGLFAVSLDFGANPFDGSDRWLEVGVRPNASAEAYTILAPRQKLTATPYALRAASVPDGSITSAKIASGAITAFNITNGAVGPAQLAPGAAAANLLAAGQSAVPSGGMILSTNANDTRLLSAGYVQIGKVDTAGAWERRTPTGPAPSPRYLHSAFWTGSEMLIWGGIDNTNTLNTGARYSPAQNRWQSISSVGAPAPRNRYSAVWTGTEIIVWGGASGPSGGYIQYNDGARYEPATDTWTPISLTNAPYSREAHSAVWTGTDMLVWGGHAGNPPTYFDDGAGYNPSSDTWTPLPSTGAPSPRSGHYSIWSGSQMLLWGGYFTSPSQGTMFTDGKRYNPATDTWLPMSKTNAPVGRTHAAALWSDNELLVWGGYTPSAANDGGRYDPIADVWSRIPNGGAPTPRGGFSSVCAGAQLIIWGGGNFSANDGGCFDLQISGWNPTTTIGAPSPRGGHTAVWTGTEMLVWGGTDNETNFADLFAYTLPKSLYLYSKP